MFLCHTLTLFRVVISPLFVFLYLRKVSSFFLISLAVTNELTDFLDGFLAKKWRCSSPLGKLLDPFSDSFWHLSALFSFTQGSLPIPLWIPLTTLWRDLFVCFLRQLYALEGIPFQAQHNAKIKSALWGISIICFLFGLDLVKHNYISPCLFKRYIYTFFSANCLLSWNTLISYYLGSLNLFRRFFKDSGL
ncbi:CDP-alcohol phosphatidyltransferase family protein [Candidatus Similichlamydia laticola]|uniref:CDP-diacylglycerol--glycerol-3-phosphate 3-phosphatidyltransferase n=1 Tax=Candidatus Similichlamydia laticola TaxID=2170265 RepID=A0A369KFQ9_9BACT|nr:CDP-alcohol phosphatidyltransferase family protein [Candidatus Similichlamydia laticola]RDB31535.1 CDP-diacylglycerol--glycerol-3-phosphate 3-phosphatidyltransferase [Candidatus Similichlamydia laticola]